MTQQLKAQNDATAAAVAPMNPGSPLVKAWWQKGSTWVSIGGGCAAAVLQIPDMPAWLKSAIAGAGILAGVAGSILAERSGVAAAQDVHAAITKE
jgi:hypothetical protein